MHFFSRRAFLQAGLALTVPAVANARKPASVKPKLFAFEDVIQRARSLAQIPYQVSQGALPNWLKNLDFDSYRNIRFRPEKAFRASRDNPFRVQLFHPGFLYQHPVRVNLLQGGIAVPLAYRSNLFDFGNKKQGRSLSAATGFAGFRLHYPLNDPAVYDELISFLGASYFRFLGRGHQYGLSARGIALHVSNSEREEFPAFREFWIDSDNAVRGYCAVYALLDGPSLTGAYQFLIYPDRQTSVDISLVLFLRRRLDNIGLAPLTSMYFSGENDPKYTEDFRSELHDSDGLLMHTGAGEWIWRPLRNPTIKQVSSFMDNNPRGFGLMQRDRNFGRYQDLEAQYHKRPAYWVEPLGKWGAGRVEIVEIPTADETHDNIVSYWCPDSPLEAGQEYSFSYNIKALWSSELLHTGGKVVNTFNVPARASGSNAPSDPLIRRFLIDFAGGDLAFYQDVSHEIELVPTATRGEILHTFLVPNKEIQGFRAAIDVRVPHGVATDLRAYLRYKQAAITETWTLLWAQS